MIETHTLEAEHGEVIIKDDGVYIHDDDSNGVYFTNDEFQTIIDRYIKFEVQKLKEESK